jgi:hypothetical protein
VSESKRYVELVNQCRDRCLWFTAVGEIPEDRGAQLHTLDCIERYGQRCDFLEARKLRQWLLQHYNEAFAVS